jgi:DNA modification methylase
VSDAFRIIHGDCREVLPTIDSGTVDAVICDPPYPEIDRSYGRLTEAQWHDLMRAVVGECRRILKPSGSAAFILQPNSREVGSMRPWLWELMAWACREWNVVQDVYWWNHAALPTVHCRRQFGLMRPSVKYCVWLGPPDCYRDQDAVLWQESQKTIAVRNGVRCRPRADSPSGHMVYRAEACSVSADRGGVTPFNLIPLGAGDGNAEGGSFGHPAATPSALMNWWIRYISPPDGLVCDPFLGSGTTALECHKLGRLFVGCDKETEYVETARRRLAEASREPSLFDAIPAGGVV